MTCLIHRSQILHITQGLVRTNLGTIQVMAQALKTVVTEVLSIGEATSRFGVPKSTLRDRDSGRVQSGAVKQPKNLPYSR